MAGMFFACFHHCPDSHELSPIEETNNLHATTVQIKVIEGQRGRLRPWEL
jgi:hypothetical protein